MRIFSSQERIHIVSMLKSVSAFLKALWIFALMYEQGFYFSRNTHRDNDGTCWGFWRFNWKTEYSLFDVDFSFGKNHKDFFHSRGDDYRMDTDLQGKSRTKRFSICKIYPPKEN